MIALSVIAAFVTILAGTFVVITRQLAVAHRDKYREEIALNDFSCASEPARAPRRAKAKPRVAAKRAKPISRPASSHGHSALLLR